MIFPIGDDQIKGGAYPYVSYAMIAINVIVFIFQFTLPEAQLQSFVYNYGSIPEEIVRGEDYYTLFTSMFLHGGIMHLIGNMLFLWVFADNIEQTVGNFNFLVFYLLGGLAAAGIHIAFNMGSTIPAIGASGAISAVMGAYLVMFPKSRVKLLVLIFFRSFYIPAFLFLGFWIGQQLVSGYMALGPESAHTAGVAWWAHIGGFVFGVIAGFFARKSAQKYITPATPNSPSPMQPKPKTSEDDFV